MELELASPNEKEKMQMRQYQAQAAPLAPQQPGMGQQMMDMAKQRAMSSALDTGQEGIMKGIGSLTPSVGALNAAKLASTPATMGMGGAEVALAGQTLAPTAGAGMAALGTAVPYVGAGLLAGKALGLFNKGGQVGPLSPRFQGIDEANLRAMQDKDALETAVTEEILDNPFSGYFSNYSPIDYFIDTPYSYNRKTQYKAQGGMTRQQAMALMNNQPDPDELYNEIVAESMTEAAQGQMPQYQTMPPTQKVMPMVGPLSVDPMGADTTYSDEMYKPINT